MDEREREERYFQTLKSRAEKMKGEEGEIAGLLIELSDSTYMREEEAPFVRLRELLNGRARNEPDKLLEPLVLAVTELAGERAGARAAWIAGNAARYPYSFGYLRKPFRTGDLDAHLPRVLMKISALLWMEAMEFSLDGYLTAPDYKVSNIYRANQAIPDVIAQQLDERSEAVESALREIVLGENQTALLSRDMVSGMLMSRREDLYKLVGDLLIAARLQEGLRQSIVESMDFGTLDAHLYLLKLIRDNGFVRYASVVRATSVWTGIPLEAAGQRAASQVLDKLYTALSDAGKRRDWLDSRSANEVHLALFAHAMREERDLPELAAGLMRGSEHYRKVAAQYVLSMSGSAEVKHASALDLLYGGETDPELLSWMISNYTYDYRIEWIMADDLDDQSAWMRDEPRRLNLHRAPGLADKEERRRQFEAFESLLETGPSKRIEAVSGALDFLVYAYEPSDALRKMMVLTAYDMDPLWVEKLIVHAGRMQAEQRQELLKYFLLHPETEAQRAFIFDCLTDKNIRNRETALKRASGLTLSEDELRRVEALLKLKTGTLRQSAARLLLSQPASLLEGSLLRLLGAKAELQRLTGLELLTELASDKERAGDSGKWIALARIAENPTPKETQLLEKLNASGRAEYTPQNGFGLYDPQAAEAWLTGGRERAADPERVFTLDAARAELFLEGLEQRIHKFRDVEYEVEYYAGRKETLLLGAELRRTAPAGGWIHSLEQDRYERQNALDMYPLADEWRAYLEESGFRADELLQLYVLRLLGDLDGKLDDHYGEFIAHYEYRQLQRIPLLEGWREEYAASLLPLQRLRELSKLLLQYERAGNLLDAFFLDSEREESFETAASVLESLIAAYPQDAPARDRPIWEVLASPWRAIMRGRVHDDDTFKRCLALTFRFDSCREQEEPNGEQAVALELPLAFKAYTLGMVGANEVYKAMLNRSASYTLRSLTNTHHASDWLKRSEDLRDMLKRVVDRLLEIELARGDLATAATPLTMALQRIEGLDVLIRILVSLGGETFVRGYIYGYGDNQTKKESLSHLLKVCYPSESDDARGLGERLEGTGIAERRLLEAAMYAPQWIDIVAEYLGWPGLRSAAWYFHAHINETFSAEKETIVAHYSPITPQEFNDGAFDVQWFEDAYAVLGEQRFKLLYECAKYISGGANHRRSQLFADAVLGRLKLKETRGQVAAKRGKDQLLAYSLIPLDGKRESDLRERYDFIQKFLLESRQFGAQRRASESAASQIALGNLARSAGYADATRMQWDLEAGKLDDLLAYTQPYEVDDVRVRLVIGDSGLPEIEAGKNGKPLKSVPSRLNKNEYIVRLKEIKSELTEQHRRFVRELERSMETAAAFAVSELVKLHGNPVVSPLLSEIVFRLAGDAAGESSSASGEDGLRLGCFRPEDRRLVALGRVSEPLPEQAELVIAHPVDLHASGLWPSLQRDHIERGLEAGRSDRAPRRQPFKQLFRELYLPNADERAAGTLSSRYAGHQVQPSKTVALLRGRGWTVSYESGLQKVDYGRNVIATLYAMADWFSPADTEAPALETIEFSDRRTHKPIKLEDVPPVLFSEIMRDIDLVVSTAHVGGVDPEASLTTIGLRTAIVRESLALLGTANVRLDGNYARIEGSLGEYAVHLGSGVAYKQASGALNIIPVHAGQRGRFFLPFLDEDPRTAEILSKIVLLAEDNKIKDPQILEQIKN
ncbi:DUF4132 domain-containing protein [Saccharibacillus sp. CPCC 101409]|uniref:DUF4132 domain-containing protein n=1 Tax=Saccharibacillus sp. CPCC 101409 TaxID=3058041 RepID=UPI002671CC23|nr:DUF4132 domain-containing protein [Saccharibacillus sp. CPCC 101409]MDO3408223.1 DUF4132 domain-containing protein [Saccharibacillus sp. CPCC 101409]